MKSVQAYIEQYKLHMLLPFISSIKLKTYASSACILKEGDPIDGLYILVEGKYRVTTNEVTGKSLLLRFCSPFSIAGDIEYFRNLPIQSEVIAEDACVFLFISIQDYECTLKKNAEFSQLLLQELAYKLQTCTVASRVNSLASVETRFASYLCSIKSNSSFGQQMKTDNLAQIASLIGTTPRHLNRVLKKLKEDGIIRKGKDELLIKDWDAIEQLSEGIRYE